MTEQQQPMLYCSLPKAPERVFPQDINERRAREIILIANKWVNGTVLHYAFFNQPAKWTASEEEKQLVRRGFEIWKSLGIGLQFKEVSATSEAEIRIGFEQGDGAWSYVGTDILNARITGGQGERTMNFGWPLAQDPRREYVAVHEIGHTLGFPHEHQNPMAGIVWDEEAVYAYFAGSPNFWTRETTFHNVISKIRPDSVQGSSWDPNSVMHYSFAAGLINKPPKFRAGLNPAGGLSERDKEWVKKFYPPLADTDYTLLKPFMSVPLSISPGQQVNFMVVPSATRYYDIQTFGISDTIMVLFEDNNGNPRYLTADDDSGQDRNASLHVKLIKDRKYILRIRLYYSQQAGESAVMMW
jgi:hypothetical protein